jgi:hypothetical protein
MEAPLKGQCQLGICREYSGVIALPYIRHPRAGLSRAEWRALSPDEQLDRLLAMSLDDKRRETGVLECQPRAGLQLDAARPPPMRRSSAPRATYNLGNFTRTLVMASPTEPRSLTNLRDKLIKIGAKVARSGRT